MTDYERRIYELVNASHSHMTAEEVHKQLKRECPSVSLATVYNNLNKLWGLKLIRKDAGSLLYHPMLEQLGMYLPYNHIVNQVVFFEGNGRLRERIARNIDIYGSNMEPD